MFDLKYVKENRDAFIYSLKNRGMDETVVNKIIENYDKMKDIMSETEKKRHDMLIRQQMSPEAGSFTLRGRLPSSRLPLNSIR